MHALFLMAAFSHHHRRRRSLLPHYYYSSAAVDDSAFMISNNNAPESGEPTECSEHYCSRTSLFGPPQPQIPVNSSSCSSFLVLMESEKKRTSCSEAQYSKRKNRKLQAARKKLQAAADRERTGWEEEAPPPPPTGYIHVRARRGQATDSHSLAERVRREKIRERMNLLQGLVPGCDKIAGKALMLDEIINYVQSLQNQVAFLSMKLACINPFLCDFGLDLIAAQTMDQAQAQQKFTVCNNSIIMSPQQESSSPSMGWIQERNHHQYHQQQRLGVVEDEEAMMRSGCTIMESNPIRDPSKTLRPHLHYQHLVGEEEAAASRRQEVLLDQFGFHSMFPLQ